MTGAGHNWVGAAEQLRSFVERAERLHAEREAIAAGIKEVYAEAKSGGEAWLRVPAMPFPLRHERGDA